MPSISFLLFLCGVALATMAMVCTLSVFNGFQDTVADLFTVFDPELKVTIAEGKFLMHRTLVFKLSGRCRK